MQAFYEIPGLNVYMQIVVTIISISVHFLYTRNKARKESTIELITIYTIGLAGWFTIMSGLFGHIIYADQVALDIGWPLHSGFQMELGFASIGMGIVGFLSFWNKSFWLPFIIPKTVFMWGAGFTHILHAVQHNNFSPGNVGIIIYWDFLFPLVMVILYLFYRREKHQLAG
ncbi:MAG: hypothetical protein IPL28_21005 [Chloroflexi bacterium]|nr:hypothetical protein [Chloroflexota bacterium]